MTRASFRSCTEAPTSRRSASSSGSRCFRPGADQYAELDFRQVQPTAMLGGIVKLQPFSDAPGFLGGEGLVQGRHSGGCSGCPEPPGPPESPGRLHPPASAYAGRSPAWYVVRSLPPAASPPKAHRPETSAGTLPPVLVVLPRRSPRLGQQRGRVSASNWVEVSSKQTTGRCGS